MSGMALVLVLSLWATQAPLVGYRARSAAQATLSERADGRSSETRDALRAGAKSFPGPFFNPRNQRVLYLLYGRREPLELKVHLERTGPLEAALEKQFERNNPVPPEAVKSLYPVSLHAARRIGALPPDTRLYLCDHDALLLNEHSQSIVDILRNAY